MTSIHGRSLVHLCLRPWAERLLDLVRPVPGDLLVDVPCDLGVMAGLLARRVPLAAVVAVDRPGAVRAAAAEMVAPAGRRPLLVAGAPERLPLPDGCADAVTSLFALPFSADPAAAVAEMRRVLRPGTGRLACAVWGRREAVPHEALVAATLAELTGTQVPAAERPLALGSDAAAQGLAAAAGPGASVLRLRDVVRFDGPQHFWQAMVRERPVHAAVEAAGEGVATELYRRLAAALEPFSVHDATVRIPVEAAVVVAGPVGPG